MTALAFLEGKPTRSCGDCRLCCRLMAVRELAKPRGKWCEHACSRGCAIYEERPQSCREFQCAWLAGWFGEDDRPDRSKVVFSFVFNWSDQGEPVSVTTVRNPETGRSYPLLAAQESFAGATLSGRARDLVGHARKSGAAVAVLLPDRPSRLYFPEGFFDFSPATAEQELEALAGPGLEYLNTKGERP